MRRLFTNMATGLSGLKSLLETSQNVIRGSATNYAKSLTWNSYISEFGTQDERNDGRAQETAALSFIHTENFVELDELRREAMMVATAAFHALKQPGGRGGGGGGSAMRADMGEGVRPRGTALTIALERRGWS